MSFYENHGNLMNNPLIINLNNETFDNLHNKLLASAESNAESDAEFLTD